MAILAIWLAYRYLTRRKCYRELSAVHVTGKRITASGKVLSVQRLEQLFRSRLRAGKGSRELRWRHRIEGKQQQPCVSKPRIPPQARELLAKGGRRPLHPHNLAQRLVKRLEQVFDNRIAPRIVIEVGSEHPARHNLGAGEGGQPERCPTGGGEKVDRPAGRAGRGAQRIGVDVGRPAQRADEGANTENRIAWQLVAGEDLAHGIELGRARLDDRGGRRGFGRERANGDRAHAPDRAGELVRARGQGGFEEGEERVALAGVFGADQAFADRDRAILAILRPGARERAQRQTFAHFCGIEGGGREQRAGKRIELAATEGEGRSVGEDGHGGSDRGPD